MRSPIQSSSSVINFAAHQRSQPFGRRRINISMGHLTSLALVKHHATEKALLVSDNGDATSAVWVPKALLTIEKHDFGRFIVATMSHTLANQKRLSPRAIDPDRYPLEAEKIALSQAVGLAARNRLHLCGHRDALPYPGRNAFA